VCACCEPCLLVCELSGQREEVNYFFPTFLFLENVCMNVLNPSHVVQFSFLADKVSEGLRYESRAQSDKNARDAKCRRRRACAMSLSHANREAIGTSMLYMHVIAICWFVNLSTRSYQHIRMCAYARIFVAPP